MNQVPIQQLSHRNRCDSAPRVAHAWRTGRWLQVLWMGLLLRGFVTLGADGFRWDPLPVPVAAGYPFPAQLRAMTGQNFDPSYEGDAELRFVVDAPRTTFLFSELSCAGGSLEIVNAGSQPLPISGTLRLYRRLPSQIPPIEFPLIDPVGAGPLPVVLQPGQVVRVGLDLPSGVLANGYYRRGPVAMYDIVSQGPAAMALLEGTNVVDFWLGTATAAPDLRVKTYAGGASLWDGPELYARSVFIQARVRRVGVVRMRSAVDWQIVGSPEPVPHRIPLPGAPQILPVSPGRVQFRGGQWSGNLVVSNAAAGATLLADDLHGHTGEASLVVNPTPQLTIATVETNVVLETGTPLPLELRIASPMTTNLPVALQASSVGKFSIPGEVVLPAGETTVRFDATPVRDPLLDGPQGVSLVASAAGAGSSAPLTLTVLDSDGPTMTLDLSNLPATPGSFAAPFLASLSLSKAPDREVTVTFETTLVKPAISLAYSHGPTLTSVVVPAGVKRIPVSGSLSPVPFTEPTQYRVRAMVLGWPAAETLVTVNPAPTDARIALGWGRGFQEGSGPNTNALSVGVHGLFPTNVTVRLRREGSALMSLPDSVEIPAYTSSVAVTPVVGDDSVLTGSLIGNIYATAPGFAEAAEVFNIADNEVGFLELSGPATPGEVPGLKSGVTNTLSVQAYSIWPNRSYFTGAVRVAVEAGVQSVTYIGPETFTMTDGGGRWTFRLVGAGNNVRFRFTLPNGSEVFSVPFEVRPDRTDPLAPADLAVTSPATVRGLVGAEGTIQVTVRNNGPAAAERFTLVATSGDPVVLGPTNTYRLDLGTLAAGVSREFNLPLLGRAAGVAGLEFRVTSDNPDPSPDDNFSRTQAGIENPPRPGVGELVQPTADLAYSTNTGRFYYSTKGGAVGEIVELDPATLATTRRFRAPAAAGLLAVTSDGLQLYALIAEGAEVLRLDLATWQTNLHVKLPTPAADLATVPNLPQRLVVYEPAAGTRLLHDGVPRGPLAGDYGWLEPDLNGTSIVSYAGNVFRYNASGGSLVRLATGSAFFPGASAWGGFRMLENRVYFADGTRWVSGNAVGTVYSGISGGVDVLPDPASDRVYFAAVQGTALELTAHSLTSGGGPVAALGLTGVQGSVNRLTRWGANGLGFRSTGGQLFFVQSPLVPTGPSTDLKVEAAELPRPAEDIHYAVRIQVSNVGPNESELVHLRVSFPAGDEPEAGIAAVVERPGAASVAVGKLAPGESREVSIPMKAGTRGTRAFAVQAMSGGTDSDPANNAAAVIVHVKEPGVAALDIAANHLLYDPVGDQFLAAVNLVAGQPLSGVLAFDPHSAMPRRWYPLPIVPGRLSRSDDGSVVYVVSANRTELRRLRLADGTVDAATKMSGVFAIGEAVVPPGRPDLVVVSRQRTDQSPSYVDVSVYKDGARLTAASTRAAYALVAPGPLGEVWGSVTEAGQFNRFQIDDTGLTPAGTTGGGVLGNTYSWQVAGDWLVSAAGDAHDRVDGKLAGTLPFGLFVAALAAHPTAGRVATLTPNYPGLPMSRLTVWDVATRKPVADRLVEELPGGANTLAYSASESFCVGGAAATGTRVTIHERAKLTGTKLSFAWTASTRNPGAQPFDTDFVLKNEGPDPAANVTVTFPMNAFDLVDSSVSGGGSLGLDPFGTWVFSATSVAPGAQVTGRLRLRGRLPGLASLAAGLSTSTMPTEPWVNRGDLVMIPAGLGDALLQGLAASCRDLAADTQRGQLWLAMPAPQNALALVDVSDRRLLEVVRLDFEPNRLAISADGRFLYAAPLSGSIGRVNLETRTVDLHIPLSTTQPEFYTTSDLSVNPGNAEMIAVAVARAGQPRTARLFEGASPRSEPYLPGADLAHLAWLGADSLALVYGSDLHRLAITPTGMELAKLYPGVAPAGFPWIAQSSGNTVLFHAGPSLDLVSGTLRDAPLESVLRVVDGPRGRRYSVNWGSQPIGNPILRNVIATEAATGAEVWRASTDVPVGDPVRFLMALPSTLVTLTAGFGESKTLWFTDLAPLDAPPARLQLTGAWSLPEIPTGYGAGLVVTLVNAGPSPARDLVLELPSGFDGTFTNLVFDPPALGAVRDGSTVKIPALPAGIGIKLNCEFGGSAVAGQLSPLFRVGSAVPANPQPFPSAEPTLLIRPAPVVSLLPATGTEGTGPGFSGTSLIVATLRLSSKPVPGVAASVRVDALPGTATAENDYRFSPTRVPIPAGRDTVTFSVQIRPDAVPEPTETFRLRVSDPVGVTLGVAEATMTILDDDVPTLNAPGIKVVEGTSVTTPARIQFTLSAPPLETARVRYFVNDGSALNRVDYVAKRGTLEFPAGSTSAELVINVAGDGRPEVAEKFEVVLLEPTGLRLGTSSVAVEIQDDDAEPVLVVDFSRLDTTGDLTFASVEGALYHLQRADTPDGPWLDLEGVVVGNGAVVTLSDRARPSGAAYYRIRRE